MLIVFGGLPGTGKTTIAKKLASSLSACYLRIDTIEQQMICNQLLAPNEIGPAGYVMASSLTNENLSLGVTVIVDAVNPLEITRKLWRELAIKNSVPILQIEIQCSSLETHKQRVENRINDIPNHTLPTWEEIQNRNYEVWNDVDMIIDTNTTSKQEAIKKIQDYIANV